MTKTLKATSKFTIIAITSTCYFCERGVATTVTYDGKALVIDGKRRVLQSGSIHYPRSTPEVWPELIRKSKEGGLDVIETYIFWNYHEPVKGEVYVILYYFEGRFDIVKFVKTVQEAGLFVHLRIGPYACAEWNYGCKKMFLKLSPLQMGFPIWLHFIPGIQFRTSNDLFQNEMKRFVTKIVDVMKGENLFASQGGPIILAQIENEYGNVEWAYGIEGQSYVKWAAEMAVGLNTTVPWVMCVQKDAPDPVINTCNGFYCDRFTPNSPSKPKMWTENYSGWFLSFGYAVPYRPVEDLAFAVARFFETGGTFQNYYMYFGGTNFGRTAGGPLIATSYDYDAPLDEYGFIRQPKWGHLRDLHLAIKQCEEYLVNADPIQQSLGGNLEAHVYYKTSNDCAAFLANYDSSSGANVTFNGNSYFLPAWSVSILPDCKNVIFNTAKVVSQRTRDDVALSRSTSVSELSLASVKWSWYKEKVGIWGNNSFTKSELVEQINTTKDTSDFLWYTTSINMNENAKLGQDVFLLIESLGHAALVFVNKKVVGFGYGNHDDPTFLFKEAVNLDSGNNTLDVLSMMIGLQNYGPWYDIQGAGITSVILSDLKNTNKSLSSTAWTYQVGLEGEYLGLDNINLANSSLWTQGNAFPINQSLIWYKDKQELENLELTVCRDSRANPLSMGPCPQFCFMPIQNLMCISYGVLSTFGQAWNCDYRGNYDSFKCLKYCGQPAQTLYHIPRTWVHSGENLLVLHEELGGDPSKISVLTRTGQEVCAHVSDSDPLPADAWKSNLEFVSRSPEVRLACEQGWQITSIAFASFGTPTGHCGAFSLGSCHINVLSIVEQCVHWPTRMFNFCLNISARGPLSWSVEKLSNRSPL
ncbi:unnamed protein product [Camellia sinensis]